MEGNCMQTFYMLIEMESPFALVQNPSWDLCHVAWEYFVFVMTWIPLLFPFLFPFVKPFFWHGVRVQVLTNKVEMRVPSKGGICKGPCFTLGFPLALHVPLLYTLVS